MIECDNIREAHDPAIISEGDSAMRVLCTICKELYIIRKDINKGVPEKRQYAKIYKRDIMQGGDNLLYKYHPEFMRT
jgi:hypothetical protein